MTAEQQDTRDQVALTLSKGDDFEPVMDSNHNNADHHSVTSYQTSVCRAYWHSKMLAENHTLLMSSTTDHEVPPLLSDTKSAEGEPQHLLAHRPSDLDATRLEQALLSASWHPLGDNHNLTDGMVNIESIDALFDETQHLSKSVAHSALPDQLSTDTLQKPSRHHQKIIDLNMFFDSFQHFKPYLSKTLKNSYLPTNLLKVVAVNPELNKLSAGLATYQCGIDKLNKLLKQHSQVELAANNYCVFMQRLITAHTHLVEIGAQAHRLLKGLLCLAPLPSPTEHTSTGGNLKDHSPAHVDRGVPFFKEKKLLIAHLTESKARLDKAQQWLKQTNRLASCVQAQLSLAKPFLAKNKGFFKKCSNHYEVYLTFLLTQELPSEGLKSELKNRLIDAILFSVLQRKPFPIVSLIQVLANDDTYQLLHSAPFSYLSAQQHNQMVITRFILTVLDECKHILTTQSTLFSDCFDVRHTNLTLYKTAAHYVELTNGFTPLCGRFAHELKQSLATQVMSQTFSPLEQSETTSPLLLRAEELAQLGEQLHEFDQFDNLKGMYHHGYRLENDAFLNHTRLVKHLAQEPTLFTYYFNDKINLYTDYQSLLVLTHKETQDLPTTCSRLNQLATDELAHLSQLISCYKKIKSQLKAFEIIKDQSIIYENRKLKLAVFQTELMQKIEKINFEGYASFCMQLKEINFSILACKAAKRRLIERQQEQYLLTDCCALSPLNNRFNPKYHQRLSPHPLDFSSVNECVCDKDHCSPSSEDDNNKLNTELAQLEILYHKLIKQLSHYHLDVTEHLATPSCTDYLSKTKAQSELMWLEPQAPCSSLEVPLLNFADLMIEHLLVNQSIRSFKQAYHNAENQSLINALFGRSLLGEEDILSLFDELNHWALSHVEESLFLTEIYLNFYLLLNLLASKLPSEATVTRQLNGKWKLLLLHFALNQISDCAPKPADASQHSCNTPSQSVIILLYFANQLNLLHKVPHIEAYQKLDPEVKSFVKHVLIPELSSNLFRDTELPMTENTQRVLAFWYKEKQHHFLLEKSSYHNEFLALIQWVVDNKNSPSFAQLSKIGQIEALQKIDEQLTADQSTSSEKQLRHNIHQKRHQPTDSPVKKHAFNQKAWFNFISYCATASGLFLLSLSLLTSGFLTQSIKFGFIYNFSAILGFCTTAVYAYRYFYLKCYPLLRIWKLAKRIRAKKQVTHFIELIKTTTMTSSEFSHHTSQRFFSQLKKRLFHYVDLYPNTLPFIKRQSHLWIKKRIQILTERQKNKRKHLVDLFKTKHSTPSKYIFNDNELSIFIQKINDHLEQNNQTKTTDETTQNNQIKTPPH